MSSKQRWKEFLTWWIEYNKQINDGMNPIIIIKNINDKIEEIKRGRNDSGK